MAHYDDGQVTFLLGDVRDVLREMPAESVNMCVTSPPYWGLRDYGTDGQLGLERTPDCGRRGMFRLRTDLTGAEREFVVRYLLGEVLPDA